MDLGSTASHGSFGKTGNPLLAMTDYLLPHDYSEYTFHALNFQYSIWGGLHNKFELCPDKDIREQDVYTIDEMVEYFICDC